MKRRLKKLVCAAIGGCMLLVSMMPAMAAEPFEVIGEVTPSDKAYSVMLTETNDMMLCNKKPVDLTVGKRYYMSYTIDEIEKNELNQNGVIISESADMEYPYLKGTMHYDFTDDLLFEEGATYFIRVEVTKKGLSYLVAKMGEKESKWIELPVQEGENTSDCQYFGLWLGGSIKAKLSAVLCYDEKGNDLGVRTNKTSGISVYDPSVLVSQEVDQYYEFSLKDAMDLAISNEKATESDVVFMSYRVENVQRNEASQAGISYNSAPSEPYPHGSGILNYEFCGGKENPLFIDGAEYLIWAQHEGDTLNTLVRRTINGVSEILAFPVYYGSVNEKCAYFSIWHGEGSYGITADIKEFQCYDAEGNNLGVQTNKEDIKITRFGAIDDYSNCEAVYWCEENNVVVILDDEQNMILTKDEKGAQQKEYTYKVDGTTLTMKMGESEAVYEYYYGYMLDAEGNRYERLHDTKVEFVTGVAEHAGNKIVNVTAADGYKVARPENPKVEGYTFEKWCLADGTEFDFDRFVTDSVTLYAKYEEGDIQTYDALGTLTGGISSTTILVVVACVLLIAGTVVGVSIMFKKEGKKNESKE